MGSADAEPKGGGPSGGGGEQYCLRWNDFQANVTGALSDIRDGEEFLDVTLVSDGREIRAHKLVLSSCSPLFRQMLKRSSAHPSPMVFLHGIRFADLSAILNFMYHGEVNVGQDELSTFLAAAEELRIRGLSEKTPEQMAAVKSQLAQSPAAAATSSKKMVAAEEGGKESSSRIPAFPKNSPSIPQEYSNDGSPLTKRMRQSDGEAEAGGDGGGGGEEEDGYVAEGAEDADGYYNHVDMYGRIVEEGEATPAQAMSLHHGLVEGEYSLHALGGRDAFDPISQILVASSPKGWHCPQCTHVSTTKGNLKAHMNSGKHKLYNVYDHRAFQCVYCHKHYSTRQSLQVHISQNHRPPPQPPQPQRHFDPGDLKPSFYPRPPLHHHPFHHHQHHLHRQSFPGHEQPVRPHPPPVRPPNHLHPHLQPQPQPQHESHQDHLRALKQERPDYHERRESEEEQSGAKHFLQEPPYPEQQGGPDPRDDPGSSGSSGAVAIPETAHQPDPNTATASAEQAFISPPSSSSQGLPSANEMQH